jgi:hypothetical protein
MFDLHTFGEICLYILPLVIIFSLFLSAFLGHLASRSQMGMQLVVMIGYLFCLGIVTHEASHRLFCALFGVKVRETRLFYVERKRTPYGEVTQIGGYVDCEEITSLITSLFLGIAPLIINGLIVALLYYYWPIMGSTPYYGLLIFVGISLGIGARPSREDLTLWVQALKRAPRRGFAEVFILISSGGLIYALAAVWQVSVWVLLTVSFSLFIGFIMIGRKRISRPYTSYFRK